MILKKKSYYTTDELFHNYSDTANVTSSKLIFAEIQQIFQCCGVREAMDWEPYYNAPNTPDSCCKKIVAGCGTNSLKNKSDIIYIHGCAGQIYLHFRSIYTALIGMNLAVMLLSLISAILGIVYERYIRQQYTLM